MNWSAASASTRATALKIGLISIDPSRKRTGGALLGDRIRMNAIEHPNIFMRSLATRDTGSEISVALPEVIAACKLSGFDLVIVETSGIGQGNAAIVPFVDVSLYVMTPEFGAASQLEKIDMLDFADFVAINKFDRKGAEDALRDVRKQYQRNREAFTTPTDDMPVFGTRPPASTTMASLRCIRRWSRSLTAKGLKLKAGKLPLVTVKQSSSQRAIVPAQRVRYLAEIADAVRGYHAHTEEQVEDRPRTPVAAHRQGHFCRLRQVDRGFRRTAGLEGRPAGPEGQEAARHVAGHRQGLQRRRIRGEDSRQGNPHQADFRVAVRHQDSQGHPAAISPTMEKCCAS